MPSQIIAVDIYNTQYVMIKDCGLTFELYASIWDVGTFTLLFTYLYIIYVSVITSSAHCDYCTHTNNARTQH